MDATSYRGCGCVVRPPGPASVRAAQPPTGGAELKNRWSFARAALGGAAAAALAAVTLAPQPAEAAPRPVSEVLSESAAGQLAATLVDRLKGATAGSYYDTKTHRLVVDVLDPGAGDAVRASGAEARSVRYSLPQLDAARVELDRSAAIPGTAWVTDPRLNQVVVTADPTVTGDRMARLNRVVSGLGEKAVVHRTATRLTRFIAGGDGIYGAKYRCSLGFNVSKDGTAPQWEGGYFLTAGHCGAVENGWSDSKGGRPIGTTESYAFPDHDYALVKYTEDVPHPSQVNLHGVLGAGAQEIKQAADARIGEAVQRSGSTSGVHGGKVTGLDATVNYAEGTVRGLIQTDVCAEGGDSGGPLFDGDKALGLTSGGSGNCTLGGTTYYQPVTAALAATGTRIP
ncbi:S1 family peptidase [Streptomyces sp. NPDC001262]|uniref:S1 family peptidase n=1 Tax=unclassified Streptomyces TaxID=2593676 RepID=UPI0036C09CD6